ncbi:MAG: hypothetical protein ACL7BU_06860 [Candidatus Phlomobacter fragariae]
MSENHSQMVIANNQLAEAHKMLINQVVGQFESEQSDTTEANKPKPFAPDTKPERLRPVAEASAKTENKPAPVVVENIVKTHKAETTEPKCIKPISKIRKPETKLEPVDIESLDLLYIVAMAVLFDDKAVKPDNMQIAKAKKTFASKKADSVTGQIHALYCTLTA